MYSLSIGRMDSTDGVGKLVGSMNNVVVQSETCRNLQNRVKTTNHEKKK